MGSDNEDIQHNLFGDENPEAQDNTGKDDTQEKTPQDSWAQENTGKDENHGKSPEDDLAQENTRDDDNRDKTFKGDPSQDKMPADEASKDNTPMDMNLDNASLKDETAKGNTPKDADQLVIAETAPSIPVSILKNATTTAHKHSNSSDHDDDNSNDNIDDNSNENDDDSSSSTNDGSGCDCNSQCGSDCECEDHGDGEGDSNDSSDEGNNNDSNDDNVSKFQSASISSTKSSPFGRGVRFSTPHASSSSHQQTTTPASSASTKPKRKTLHVNPLLVWPLKSKKPSTASPAKSKSKTDGWKNAIFKDTQLLVFGSKKSTSTAPKTQGPIARQQSVEETSTSGHMASSSSKQGAHPCTPSTNNVTCCSQSSHHAAASTQSTHPMSSAAPRHNAMSKPINYYPIVARAPHSGDRYWCTGCPYGTLKNAGHKFCIVCGAQLPTAAPLPPRPVAPLPPRPLDMSRPENAKHFIPTPATRTRAPPAPLNNAQPSATDNATWTEEQNATIMAMKADNKSWKQIGDAVSKSAGQVKAHHKELLKQQNAPATKRMSGYGMESEGEGYETAAEGHDNAGDNGWPTSSKPASPSPSAAGGFGAAPADATAWAAKVTDPETQNYTDPGVNWFPRTPIYKADTNEELGITAALRIGALVEHYEREKWLRVASTWFDETGQRLSVEELKKAYAKEKQ